MSVPAADASYLNSTLNADSENIYIDYIVRGPFSTELLGVLMSFLYYEMNE